MFLVGSLVIGHTMHIGRCLVHSSLGHPWIIQVFTHQLMFGDGFVCPNIFYNATTVKTTDNPFYQCFFWQQSFASFQPSLRTLDLLVQGWKFQLFRQDPTIFSTFLEVVWPPHFSSGFKKLPFSPRFDLERFFKAQGLGFIYSQGGYRNFQCSGSNNLIACIGFLFFHP